MTQLAENHHAKKSTKSNSNIVIAILDFSLLLLRKVNLLNYQHAKKFNKVDENNICAPKNLKKS